MNVLIVYGTTEGQTRKIAEWTATRIRERGHQAELLDSAAPVSDLDFAAYDAFIIAASVHQELIAHLGVLDTKPSAFISVSLSAVLDAKTEAQKYVDSFVSVTGLAAAQDPPSRGRSALHGIRLLPRADRQIHRHEARRCSEYHAGPRVHRLECSCRLR